MHSVHRRDFLRSSFFGASGAIVGFPHITLQDSNKPMQKKLLTRKLGKTGIILPIVSMGVMRADNPGLVRAALQSGMVHLDTAHGYQGGRNEEMLGEVLRDYSRDSFVIATKVQATDKEEFLEMLNLSLERLKMPYVDILYLHGIASREDVLNEEYLAGLKAAKESGKAKHIGFSTHKNEPETIRAAIEGGVHEVVLTAFNFMQEHSPDLKKAIGEAAASGIGIVAMKTMAGGFFDRAKTKPVNCKAALKWVLQDTNVTTTIPGVKTFDQLAENATVNEDLTLTEEERSALLIGALEPGLYCNGCNECVGSCRNALPIPEMMRAYMYTYGYSDAGLGKEVVEDLSLPASPCAGCESCSSRCVKGFAVRERIEDVIRLRRVPREFLA